jgi:hypothetical protein
MSHQELQERAAYYAVINEEERMRPCVIWKPRLSIDGNKWCAIHGDNLQDGVAGFGDSPAEAMVEFDKAWNAKLAKQEGLVAGADGK